MSSHLPTTRTLPVRKIIKDTLNIVLFSFVIALFSFAIVFLSFDLSTGG